MQEVSVSETINVPAEEAWKLVGNFGALHLFVEGIAKCTTDGHEAGAIRTLTLQDGGEVKEQLESLDNEKKVLKYTILESPMPIENYVGKMEVNKLSDTKSEFIWSSTFEAAEGTEEEMKKALSGLYSLGVEGLKKKFS